MFDGCGVGHRWKERRGENKSEAYGWFFFSYQYLAEICHASYESRYVKEIRQKQVHLISGMSFFLEWTGKKLSVLRLWYVTKISLEDFSSWKFKKRMSELKYKSKQHNLKWGMQHMTKKTNSPLWYWLHYYSSASVRIRSRKQSKFYHLLVLCSAQFIKLTPTHKVLGLCESSPYFRS